MIISKTLLVKYGLKDVFSNQIHSVVNLLWYPLYFSPFLPPSLFSPLPLPFIFFPSLLSSCFWGKKGNKLERRITWTKSTFIRRPVFLILGGLNEKQRRGGIQGQDAVGGRTLRCGNERLTGLYRYWEVKPLILGRCCV